MNAKYGVTLEKTEIKCEFSGKNQQCIGTRCPLIGRDFDDNWGLEDPTDQSDEEFIKVIREIEKRIKAML